MFDPPELIHSLARWGTYALAVVGVSLVECLALRALPRVAMAPTQSTSAAMRRRPVRMVMAPLTSGAVVMEARHLCMMMRGVEKQNTVAVSSSMLGVFRTQQQTREEFLKLIRGSSVKDGS